MSRNQTKTNRKLPMERAVRKGSPASIEERVRRIITDVDRFDYDTRSVVWCALKSWRFKKRGDDPPPRFSDAEREELRRSAPEDERNLIRLVERAEAGEYLGFCSAGEEYLGAARRLLNLMHSPGTPVFITQGIYDLLLIAQKTFGVRLFRDEIDAAETGGWSLDALATVFMRHEPERFEIETKRDLPELISAVLTHEDAPDCLVNAMGEALDGLPGYSATHRTAPFLRELLRLTAETEEAQA